MSATVSPTQTQIFTALVTVLASFGLASSTPQLPIPIIRGQVNRVPEPSAADFIVLWPIARDRLAMNIDSWVDTQITGSIANNVLTVATVVRGQVDPGASIYATGITPGCQIVRQLSGTPNGVGTYSVTPTAPVTGITLYAGTLAALQKTEVTVQADVHGPSSADNAARIATLFRDQYGVSAFQTAGIALCPLYTSEPRQMPFDNGEQQVEERWVVDLCMQADVTITTTMQFADQLDITLFNVETVVEA